MLSQFKSPLIYVILGAAVAKGLFLNEAILTGESEPRNTKLGEIAHSITQTDDQETPLQKRLGVFSNTLTKLTAAITVIMYVIGVANGKPKDCLSQ